MPGKEVVRLEQRGPVMATHSIPEPSWNVLPPTVIRYLERKHVDAFFETGELQLSSFQQFRKHKDEQRLDVSEGLVVVETRGPSQDTITKISVGKNELVLSTSILESREMQDRFKCDAYFRITDTIRFAYAVGTQLPDYIGGFEGFCKYSEQRSIRRRVPLDFKDLAGPDGRVSTTQLWNFICLSAGEDVFLVKHPEYRDQLEYRFVWRVKGPVPPTLKIFCPEARQYCERP